MFMADFPGIIEEPAISFTTHERLLDRAYHDDAACLDE